MSRWVSILGAVALVAVTTVVQGRQKGDGDRTGTLKVSGMACSVCASTVEKAAAKIDGVKIAKANQPQGTAEITYDSTKLTLEAIAKAISAKTGFAVEVPKSTRK